MPRHNSTFQKFALLFLIAVFVFPLPSHAEHSHPEHDEHGGHEEEGVVHISPQALRAAKIEIAEVGPQTLKTKLKVNGRISPVSSNVAHITSRFPGILKDVRKDIGDQVKAGEVLAIVESNQNLQSLEIRASKAGLVTERHATLGEFAAEGEMLFVVVDFSVLWTDFTVFQRDVSKIRHGLAVKINAEGDNPAINSTIGFISPVVDEATQSRLARSLISNPPTYLSPGAFVTGEIATEEFQVPLAVTYEAVQTIDGNSVIFVNDGDAFTLRQLTLGRSDGDFFEVLSGLKSGEKYASKNTFLLKAELGKSEAEHQH